MQREDITKLKEQAEARCRLYFDEMTTMQNQVTQKATQLEQERGAARALAELERMWPDPQPPAPEASTGDFTEPGGMPATAPAGQSLIPVPSSSKSKVKEKTP